MLSRFRKGGGKPLAQAQAQAQAPGDSSSATSTPTKNAQKPSKRQLLWDGFSSILGPTSGSSTRATTPVPPPSPANFTQNSTITSMHTANALEVPLVHISHEELDVGDNDTAAAAPNNPRKGLHELLQLDAGTLWIKAYNELPTEYKQDLECVNNTDSDKPEKLEVLKQLLEHAMEARRTNIASQWKLKWGDKEINVREKAEKLVGWIVKFKEVVDVAVQYDPVHAALPWAGVRFILTVCPSRAYTKSFYIQST